MNRFNFKAKISLLALTAISVLGAVGFGTPTVNAAQQPLPASPYYVALGDSIAAGAGLPVGSRPEDAPCGRSASAYPNLLAIKLNARVMNLACSGAKDSDGIIGAQVIKNANVTIPSQLDRAFEYGTPDLMTITIGANDIRWVDFISKCYITTCGDWKDTGAEAAYLTYFQSKLAYTLHQIKDRSGSNTPPKVLVTGYYSPVSSTSCLNGQVTAAELRWINAQTDNLNKSIRQTIAATTKVSSWFKSTYNFATYVPVNFSGHGLCSATPWVQGPTDAAPLHPTATGAAQIANTLYTYAR